MSTSCSFYAMKSRTSTFYSLNSFILARFNIDHYSSRSIWIEQSNITSEYISTKLWSNMDMVHWKDLLQNKLRMYDIIMSTRSVSNRCTRKKSQVIIEIMSINKRVDWNRMVQSMLILWSRYFRQIKKIRRIRLSKNKMPKKFERW